MLRASPLTERGFTLIEFVTVLVVVALLAAVALAKFMDASDEAHDSANMGALGVLATAVASVRAQWLADGANGTTVNFDGEAVPVSGQGWPTPVAGTTDCSDLWRDLLHNPAPVIPYATPLNKGKGYWAFTSTNANASLCLYIYRPTYPERVIWILYYAHHATLPQWRGRIIKSGF